MLRGKGDTQRPLNILLLAGCVNVVLNLLLVIVLHMGVAGVATATGCANVFSALAILRLLRREKGPFRLTRLRLRIDRAALRQILFIECPQAYKAWSSR